MPDASEECGWASPHQVRHHLVVDFQDWVCHDMQDLISLWEFLLIINVLCSSPLLSALQSNMSLVGIVETQGAVISAELSVYAEVSCTWNGWCNTLHDGWLKIAFLLCIYQCWISLIVILSSILLCLGPSEVPHSFLVLSNLDSFMSWADFVPFLHSLLALLLLKYFIWV